MRVFLVGPPHEREELRRHLPASMEIAGEFPTLAAARRTSLRADAVVISRDDREPAFSEPLTPREVEVLELLSEGLSNKGIAGQLGISDQTVKFHVASICGKLDAANRTDAVRRALRRGLVSL